MSGCIRTTLKWIIEKQISFGTFGTRSCLKKQYLSEIRVGNDVVKGSETIRFLGIILDKELDMKTFKAAKARTAYFNIQKSRRLENI